MKIKGLKKEYWAYVVAVVLFVASACAYCLPYLEGKRLSTHDQQSWQSASEEGRKAAQTGDGPSWWSGSMFSGMPTYQIGAGGVYKADNLLKPVDKILHKGVYSPIWKLIFYFSAAFILFLAFGVSPWLSIAGAFAVGLSSYFLTIIPAGHDTKTATIALTFVVIAGFKFIFNRKYLLGAFLVMLFICAGYSLHPQMFYYFYMLIGMLWIAELWIHLKEKRYKDLVIATCVFALATVVGVGTKCSNLFANSEFVKETTRGRASELNLTDAGAQNSGGEAASAKEASAGAQKGMELNKVTEWSYGIDETLSLLVPGVKGGASSVELKNDRKARAAMKRAMVKDEYAKEICKSFPMYWGSQPFTAGNVYVGAIICFLFLLGLLIVEGPYKWMLLASTIFSIALAWGSNMMWLTKIFYNWFPMYGKFRVVSSILVVAEVAMPLLGILAVKEITEGKVEKKKKLGRSLLISAGVTAGICLLLAVFGGLFYDFSTSRDGKFFGDSGVPQWMLDILHSERRALLLRDCFRSIAFIAAAFGVLWFYAKGKLRTAAMVPVLGLLIAVDLWGVDRRYFGDRNFHDVQQVTSAFEMLDYEKVLLKDKDPHFRVYNLKDNPFKEARTSLNLKSIGGYSAVKLRRYQDLIDAHLTKMHLPVISMLNTKYIISKDAEGKTVIRQNQGALGNAWWVDNVKFVNGAQAESDALLKVDLRRTAIVDNNFKSYVKNGHPGTAAQGRIKLTKYTPKTLTYATDSPAPGIVVFSEIYYPHGWKIWIDKKEAECFRADYTLRAMNVPAGRHTITFTFDPDSVKRGDRIATIFIVIMYLSGIVAIAWGIVQIFGRKSRNNLSKTTKD